MTSMRCCKIIRELFTVLAVFIIIVSVIMLIAIPGVKADSEKKGQMIDICVKMLIGSVVSLCVLCLCSGINNNAYEEQEEGIEEPHDPDPEHDSIYDISDNQSWCETESVHSINTPIRLVL